MNPNDYHRRITAIGWFMSLIFLILLVRIWLNPPLTSQRYKPSPQSAGIYTAGEQHASFRAGA